MPAGDHPLLLGMTGFWGTPVANDKCRKADVILAVGTRLAEASSSSWDPRFTFAAPPTRCIHIDADLAEIGRNLPTELGVIADAKLALGALADAARGRQHRDRGRLREEIDRGRRAFTEEWADQWTSDQFPLRPERILSELRQALPEDGFVVTDVGWNKNGVAQQFAITVPGTFITPSGLATMGFGAAAVLGAKVAQPDRAAVALIGDGGFGANPNVVATAMEAGLNVVWLIMDNAAFGTIAGLENMHYGTTFGCVFQCNGKPYRVDFAAMARAWGAHGVMVQSAAELGPALRDALASRSPRSSRCRWRTPRRRRRDTGTSTTSIARATSRGVHEPHTRALHRPPLHAGARDHHVSRSRRDLVGRAGHSRRARPEPDPDGMGLQRLHLRLRGLRNPERMDGRRDRPAQGPDTDRPVVVGVHDRSRVRPGTSCR